MIEITLDTNQIKELTQNLCKISPKNRESVTKKAFTDLTLSIEQKLKFNLTNRILHVRSGRLRTSIGSIVDETERGLAGLIGSGVRTGQRVKYANIHETGGTITPKGHPYLTIPLSGALTLSGSQLRGHATSARDFPNTFVRRSKSGNLMIFQNKGGRAVPLFLLVRSIKIPARYYMSKTTEQMLPVVMNIMLHSIDKAFEKQNIARN